MIQIADKMIYRPASRFSQWTILAGVLLALNILSPNIAARADATLNEAVHESVPTGSFTESERDAVEAIVRDLIRRNPEIIGDAMQVVIERQIRAEEERARKNNRLQIAALAKQNLGLERGNPNGDVLVIEFADYNCGWCKRAHNGVLEEVAADGNVRFLYKEFPVLGPISVFASKVALASANQGGYGDFNNRLMNQQGRLTEMSVLALAEELGMDPERLTVDMELPEIADMLAANKRIAQTIGIEGTPAFLIGDRLYRGYLDKDDLRKAIQKARADKTG